VVVFLRCGAVCRLSSMQCPRAPNEATFLAFLFRHVIPLHRFVQRQVDAMYWTNSLSEVDLLNRAGPIMTSFWRGERFLGAERESSHMADV